MADKIVVPYPRYTLKKNVLKEDEEVVTIRDFRIWSDKVTQIINALNTRVTALEP